MQVIKSTTREVIVRPCFDLREPTTGVGRGDVIKVPHSVAMAHLVATNAP